MILLNTEINWEGCLDLSALANILNILYTMVPIENATGEMYQYEDF